MDVTHVRWDCCTHSLLRRYTGKEGFPTIAYQVTVDQSGRSSAATEGFPGAQNDKTIVRYDFAVQTIRDNSKYRDKVFNLRAEDGSFIECKGNYLIVGNGYHKVEGGCYVSQIEGRIARHVVRKRTRLPVRGSTRPAGENSLSQFVVSFLHLKTLYSYRVRYIIYFRYRWRFGFRSY